VPGDLEEKKPAKLRRGVIYISRDGGTREITDDAPTNMLGAVSMCELSFVHTTRAYAGRYKWYCCS
jgi:hypothetical protein